MADRTLVLRLPEDLVASLGSDEVAAEKAKEALVFELVREGRLGQSRAGELLGITRSAVLALLTRYGIDQGPSTADELARDAANADRAASA